MLDNEPAGSKVGTEGRLQACVLCRVSSYAWQTRWITSLREASKLE